MTVPLANSVDLPKICHGGSCRNRYDNGNLPKCVRSIFTELLQNGLKMVIFHSGFYKNCRENEIVTAVPAHGGWSRRENDRHNASPPYSHDSFNRREK